MTGTGWDDAPAGGGVAMRTAARRSVSARTVSACVLAVILSACGDGRSGSDNPPSEFPATGFYRVAQTSERWWLAHPAGHRFYAIAINHVDSRGYTDRTTGTCPYCETIARKYGDAQRWREAAVGRLQEWGFNTIGAWSDGEGFGTAMAYTPILNIGSGVKDYFSTELEQQAARIAASAVRPRRDDSNLLGWFLGNEMHWGRDWRSQHPLLEDYLELPEEAPGRVVAEAHRGDPGGFLLAVADRYFAVATRAVRAEDPNHLILGVRASTIATPPEVVQAAAPWLDVFSVNHYDLPPGWQGLYNVFDTTESDDWLRRYHELSRLPLMITEFTYRAKESDVPNTYPPIYYLFETQAERAEAMRTYVQRCYDAPYIVGHHWFEYYDDPPGGRSDGEDSNFGLVSNDDEPYAAMVETMKKIHARAPHLSALGAAQPSGMATNRP